MRTGVKLAAVAVVAEQAVQGYAFGKVMFSRLHFCYQLSIIVAATAVVKRAAIWEFIKAQLGALADFHYTPQWLKVAIDKFLLPDLT